MNEILEQTCAECDSEFEIELESKEWVTVNCPLCREQWMVRL